jgi:outer membrane protein assembly factor BamB
MRTAQYPISSAQTNLAYTVNLRANDITSGDLLWQHVVSDVQSCQLAQVNEAYAMIFCADPISGATRLFAFDTLNGSLLWQRSSATIPDLGPSSSFTAIGNRYLTINQGNFPSAQPHPAVTLDINTGEVLPFNLGEQSGLCRTLSIYGVESDDPDLNWYQFLTPGCNWLLAFDQAGNLKRRLSMTDIPSPRNVIAVDATDVIIVGFIPGEQLGAKRLRFAIDGGNAQTVWDASLGTLGNNGRALLITNQLVTSARVFVGNRSVIRVTSVSSDDGHALWSQDIEPNPLQFFNPFHTLSTFGNELLVLHGASSGDLPRQYMAEHLRLSDGFLVGAQYLSPPSTDFSRPSKKIAFTVKALSDAEFLVNIYGRNTADRNAFNYVARINPIAGVRTGNIGLTGEAKIVQTENGNQIEFKWHASNLSASTATVRLHDLINPTLARFSTNCQVSPPSSCSNATLFDADAQTVTLAPNANAIWTVTSWMEPYRELIVLTCAIPSSDLMDTNPSNNCVRLEIGRIIFANGLESN